jgi:hypothetical protein
MSDEIAKMAAGFAAQQNNNVVPFGKYRGMPVEVMQQDQSYFNWAYAQEDIRKRYPWLFGLQVIQVQEMQDTPEHNSYQVLFLDQDFIDDVWDIVFPGHRVAHALGDRACRLHYATADLRKAISSAERDIDYERYGEHYAGKAAAARLQLVELQKELAVITELDMWEALCPVRREELPAVEAAFEVRGYRDNNGRLQNGGSADVQLECLYRICRIEIKPSMGDDYPSVLRQMKASGCDVLYLGHYAGSGATLAQVRRIFEASDIRILLDQY